MAWTTGVAQKRPLGSQTEPRMARHDIICIHTMVGFLYSTDLMFKGSGYSGTESHYGVGGKWGSDDTRGLDGVAYQWQDTDYQADANLDGNPRVLSIETADNAPRLAADIQAWTPKQVAKIVDIICDLCKRYDIPAVLVPDTKPGRRGLAYHAQGIEPAKVSGGEKWSKANGKECPGPVRIRQFKNEVIPKVQAKLAGKDWFDMADKKDLKAALLEVLKDEPFIANLPLNPGDPQGSDWRFSDWAAAQDKKQDRNNTRFEAQDKLISEIKKQNDRMSEQLDAILALVSPQAPAS